MTVQRAQYMTRAEVEQMKQDLQQALKTPEAKKDPYYRCRLASCLPQPRKPALLPSAKLFCNQRAHRAAQSQARPRIWSHRLKLSQR